MNGRDMVRVSDGAHFYIPIFFKKVGTTKMQNIIWNMYHPTCCNSTNCNACTDIHQKYFLHINSCLVPAKFLFHQSKNLWAKTQGKDVKPFINYSIIIPIMLLIQVFSWNDWYVYANNLKQSISHFLTQVRQHVLMFYWTIIFSKALALIKQQ